MAEYSYKVKDKAGNTRTGTLKAGSEREAAAMIREAGGLPMEIKLVGAAAKSSDALAGPAIARYLIHPFWTGVGITNLVYFYRQLATLLAAGMTASEALRAIGERQGGVLGRIARSAQERVQNGGRLSDELARHPRIFLPLQMSLIRAGEHVGLLDKMAERVAEYLEYEIHIRQQVAKAVFYPIICLLLLLMLPVVLVWVLDSNEVAWLKFLSQCQLYVLPLFIAMIVSKFLAQFEPMRLAWDATKIQQPILGMVARKIAMSRFSRALALLYSAGLPVTQAVSIAADACANIAISRRLKSAIPALSEGQPLTESLRKTGVMLPVVLDMMAIGEKTGNPDVVLKKVADYMDAEADATIQKMSIALFVLMIIVVGIMVAKAAMEVMSGYVSKVGGAAK